jgi:uncharacterized membrane protein
MITMSPGRNLFGSRQFSSSMPGHNETRKLKLFPRLWHLHARLFLSLGFGAAVALSLLALPWRVSTRVIFGWDAGVALYIALIFLVMAQGSIAKIRRRAAINDEGAIAVLVLTAAASLASLASVLVELGHSPSPYQILLGIATILLSWTFMHTMFALHYGASIRAGPGPSPVRPTSRN